MTLQTVELPEEVIQRAKALTGKRTARAAVVAALDALNVDKSRPKGLPRTVAEEARAERGAKRFKSASAAVRYLKTL